jgi:carbon-monoxide dehydrogenase medium subunit
MQMQEFDFIKPETLDELRLALLKDRCGFIAGGTDLLPVWNRNSSLEKPVWIDLTHIKALRFIREEGNEIQIGALTILNDLLDSEVLNQYASGLVQAIATIGCVQTRNRGTLGGNLANASPAADCAPPLITLEARVHVYSPQGMRQVNLDSFFTHPGQTVLSEQEIIHSISFDKPIGVWGGIFIKHGNRRGMAISVASAAAFLQLDQAGQVSKVRVAVGSLAPTPVRVKSAEAAALGSNLDIEDWQIKPDQILDDIHPIGDLRATAEHRIQAGAVLISRAIRQAYVDAKRRLI